MPPDTPGMLPRASKAEPHRENWLNTARADRKAEFDEKVRDARYAKSESGRVSRFDRRSGIADSANVIEHVKSEAEPLPLSVDIEISDLGFAKTVLQRGVDHTIAAAG